MTATREGGLKAAEANKAKYGKDFYIKIGRKGGLAAKTKPSGFAARPELASAAGIKGGLARGYKRRMNNV